MSPKGQKGTQKVDDILDLMDQSRKVKNNPNLYQSLNKRVRKECHEAEEECLNKKCCNIEACNILKCSEELYEEIN